MKKKQLIISVGREFGSGGHEIAQGLAELGIGVYFQTVCGDNPDRLKSVLGLETRVTLVEPKSLERFQGKAKRILDLRNQPEE